MLQEVRAGVTHGLHWAIQGFPDRLDELPYSRTGRHRRGVWYWVSFLSIAAIAGLALLAAVLAGVITVAVLAGP